MNHHRGGPRESGLPNLHLMITNSRDQRRISLTESSPIRKDLIEKLVLEKKRKSIEKGAARARSPSHEFAIGSTQGEDRKDLKILGHRSRAPGDFENPTNRWAHGHVLAQTHHTTQRLHPGLEEELQLSVGDDLSHGGHSEGTQITQYGDGLEEVGLALTVRSGDQIAGAAPRNRFRHEVAKTRGSDLDETHRSPSLETVWIHRARGGYNLMGMRT